MVKGTIMLYEDRNCKGLVIAIPKKSTDSKLVKIKFISLLVDDARTDLSIWYTTYSRYLTNITLLRKELK